MQANGIRLRRPGCVLQGEDTTSGRKYKQDGSAENNECGQEISASQNFHDWFLLQTVRCANSGIDLLP
jgi:hypothetical protein